MDVCTAGDELLRLAELKRLSISGPGSEPVFEELANLAAKLLRAPVGAIMLLDHDREWTMASVGMARGYGDRDVAFCAHTILRTQPLLVDDTRQDPRFCDNPYVVEGGVRAYAGAPLRTTTGQNIGTVCIRDFKPRNFTPEDARTLTALAEVVMRELEGRLACSAPEKPRHFAQTAELAQMEFLAAFSREMRRPLGKILAIADRLSIADLNPTERAQAALDIRHDGRGLLDLLGDLLDFTDLELKRDAVEIRTCNPGVIIQTCVNEIRPLAERCGITLRCAISPDLPEELDTDGGRLRRIACSLLRNSLRCLDHGTVTVTAELIPPSATSTQMLRVEVHHAAPYIATETPANQRADNRDTMPSPAGLAVQIARRAANLLGGDVVLVRGASDDVCFRATIHAGTPVVGADEGMHADVGLDVARELTGHEAGAATLFDDTLLSGRKVLVAGSTAAQDGSLAAALTGLGMQVTCVPDGKHAIGAVMGATDAGMPFDVVLMDYEMPTLAGIDVAREFRYLGYVGQILLVCSTSNDQQRRTAADAGADDVIGLPYDTRALVRQMAKGIRAAGAAPAMAAT